MSSFLAVVWVGGPRNPTNIFLFYFSATMQGMESSLQQPHTVANILAPVRNIDLECHLEIPYETIRRVCARCSVTSHRAQDYDM